MELGANGTPVTCVTLRYVCYWHRCKHEWQICYFSNKFRNATKFLCDRLCTRIDASFVFFFFLRIRISRRHVPCTFFCIRITEFQLDVLGVCAKASRVLVDSCYVVWNIFLFLIQHCASVRYRSNAHSNADIMTRHDDTLTFPFLFLFLSWQTFNSTVSWRLKTCFVQLASLRFFWFSSLDQ